MSNEADKKLIMAALCKTFDDIEISEPFKVERMGGLTNRTYKVYVDSNRTVVVRLPGEGTEELINRGHEKLSTELACAIGVDAKLYSFDEETGIKISEYIGASQTMSAQTMRTPENIKLAAQLLSRLHNCSISTGVPFDVIDMAESYEKIIRANDVPLYNDYEEVKNIIRQIKKDYLPGVSKVACHNDPLCENWILQNNEKLYLIDWEYAGMNDPMWDLADVSIEAGYDAAMDQLLLETYFNRAPGPSEMKAFFINKVLIDYLWSLWGKTRVPYDGQVMEDYALERYLRMKESMKMI